MEVGWWLFRKAVGLEWEAQSEISDLFSKSELEAILAKGAEADKAAHAIEGVVAWVASNKARMQWHANAPENAMAIIGRMREEKGERAVYLVPDALHDYLKGRGLNVKATVATFLDRGEHGRPQWHWPRGDLKSPFGRAAHPAKRHGLCLQRGAL